MNLNLGSLPPSVLAVLGVLALVQLTLDVIALVDLARRPRESVVFGNRWVWLAIIVLVNLLGAIVYLVIGRRQASPPGDYWTPPGTGAKPASSIADELYGTRNEQPGAGESQ